MGKGNLIQGMGRGKLGDTVFYRMNGQQMFRIRNRRPSNPRTNAQLYQRAIIATIMKLYSAGKEIFDHSFQGYKVGEENMRRFLSVNSTILREQIANDVNENKQLSQQLGRVVPAKVETIVPNIGTIVSEGNYDQTLFTFNPATASSNASWTIAKPNTGEKLGDYMQRVGIVPNDLYTLVYVIVDKNAQLYSTPNENSDYSKAYEARFGFIRLKVYDNVDTETTVDGLLVSSLFEIDMQGANGLQITEGASLKAEKTLEFSNLNTNLLGVCALIRSRVDEDLRSTSQMQQLTNSKAYGIATSFIINAWQHGTTRIGNSDLILEGGNGQNGPSGFPVEDVALNSETPVAEVPKTATLSKKK